MLSCKKMIQTFMGYGITQKRRSLSVAHKVFSNTTSFQNKQEEIRINPQITIRNEDETQKSPLVFIFGWGNGTKRNLLKYSEMFEKRNFTTVLVTTTLINSLFRSGTAGRREGLHAQKVLFESCNKNKDRKVIIFSFSNGGCAISHMMIDGMDSESFPGKNLKGQIFDSCPIVPNEGSAVAVSKAFTGLFKNRVVQSIVAGLAKIMVFVVINMSKNVDEFMASMRDSKINSPQLFLFSKDDDLAPYKDILSFVEERNKKGITVQYKLWETSQHCGHMRNYPEEYRSLVEIFIDQCLLDEVSIKSKL